LLAAGVAMVIITRNIDVSVGSTMALTGILGGLMLREGLPTILVVPLVVLLGGALGAVNGLGVTFGRVPSIVMTLGTLGAYRGISFMITGGRSVENIPPSYKQLGVTKLAGIPVIVWGATALLVLLMVAMARTRTGRHLYATGDNAAGAHLIGIRTTGMVVLAFAASGALAATAALVFLAQIGSVSNQAGMGIEMRAIAAAVIGGVALSGGVGTILGATFGAIFITTATSSLSFLGIPGFWADTVIGAILLIALFADARVRAELERRRLAARYRSDLRAPGERPPGGTPAPVAAAEGVQVTGGAS
ncbi:MAG TPA: ABC transporter permease, partial [Cellulomonas sp.]